MTEAAAQTNGESKTKKSKLQLIRDEFEAGGSKLPPQGERDKIKVELREARKKREKAEADLEAAQKAEDAITEKSIRAFGGKSVDLDGQRLEPGCRGERLYYKSGDSESV